MKETCRLTHTRLGGKIFLFSRLGSTPLNEVWLKLIWAYWMAEEPHGDCV